MPSRRRFGTEITGNRRYNHEFSSEARAAIIAKMDEGKSLRSVAREFKTTHGTIQYIKQHWQLTHTTRDNPRSGRPEELTETEKRYIVRLAKKDPDVSWNCLRGESGTRVSARTIRRIVRRYFSRKWRAQQRPNITKEATRARLESARRQLP